MDVVAISRGSDAGIDMDGYILMGMDLHGFGYRVMSRLPKHPPKPGVVMDGMRSYMKRTIRGEVGRFPLFCCRSCGAEQV